MGNITRSRIADTVSRKTDIQLKDVAAIIDAVFETLAESLEKGDTVEIRAFGTFYVGVQRAKIFHHNVWTGKKGPVHVPPKVVPKWRYSKTLSARTAKLMTPDLAAGF